MVSLRTSGATAGSGSSIPLASPLSSISLAPLRSSHPSALSWSLNPLTLPHPPAQWHHPGSPGPLASLPSLPVSVFYPFGSADSPVVVFCSTGSPVVSSSSGSLVISSSSGSPIVSSFHYGPSAGSFMDSCSFSSSVVSSSTGFSVVSSSSGSVSSSRGSWPSFLSPYGHHHLLPSLCSFCLQMYPLKHNLMDHKQSNPRLNP